MISSKIIFEQHKHGWTDCINYFEWWYFDMEKFEELNETFQHNNKTWVYPIYYSREPLI
jgi:hypothetical protein